MASKVSASAKIDPDSKVIEMGRTKEALNGSTVTEHLAEVCTKNMADELE